MLLNSDFGWQFGNCESELRSRTNDVIILCGIKVRVFTEIGEW